MEQLDRRRGGPVGHTGPNGGLWNKNWNIPLDFLPTPVNYLGDFELTMAAR